MIRHQKHWGSHVITKNTVSLQLLSSTPGRYNASALSSPCALVRGRIGVEKEREPLEMRQGAGKNKCLLTRTTQNCVALCAAGGVGDDFILFRVIVST